MAFSFTKFLKGITILPTSSSNASVAGDMEVVTVGGVPRVQYHNGSTVSPVVTLTSADQGAQRLQNKDIDASSGNVVDASDTTKKVGWSVSGATTGTKTTLTFTQTVNRTLTLPDATDTLVGKATTDTLTNKTLTSPTINNGTITSATITTPTLNGSGGQLSLPAGPDTLVGRATTDTLTNKTLTSPTITTPTLNGSGGQLTLPAGPDTLIGRATTDTLTNKTIAAASNTISGLTNSNLSGSAGITYANLSVANSIKASDINSQTATNGQVLTANGSGAATFVTQASSTPRNYIINSNFDFWQRGTSKTSITTQAYLADRWYANGSNLTGGTGVSFQQSTTVPNGSKYSAEVLVTTDGTAGQPELYYMLENSDSLPFYNQTASFSAQIQAAGTINQIGIQFVYETSEQKSTGLHTIGVETLVSINSSGFTPCTISGQAIGTAQGTGGIIGIRIRPTGASTGHTYTGNNGFIITQAQLNLGSVVGTYQRCGNSIAEELMLCQRYYEKSYDVTVNPGTVTNTGCGAAFNFAAFTANTYYASPKYSVPKRLDVNLPVIYSPAILNSSGNVRDITSGADTAASVPFHGTTTFTIAANITSSHAIIYHWTSDQEI